MTRCILHRYKYKDLAKSLILGAVESLKVWKRLEAEYSMTDTRALADGSSIVEFQPGIWSKLNNTNGHNFDSDVFSHIL